MGLDGFFRLYVGAAKELAFSTELVIHGQKLPEDYYVSIKRPSCMRAKYVEPVVRETICSLR